MIRYKKYSSETSVKVRTAESGGSFSVSSDTNSVIEQLPDWNRKADKAETLEGYGITDAYTKTETLTEINNALRDYISSTDFNTAKTNLESQIQQKVSGDSCSEYRQVIAANLAAAVADINTNLIKDNASKITEYLMPSNNIIYNIFTSAGGVIPAGINDNTLTNTAYLTYTAPANGYITALIGRINNYHGQLQAVQYRNGTMIDVFYFTVRAAVIDWEATTMKMTVKKNDEVRIWAYTDVPEQNVAGTIYDNYFVYAEGEIV